MSSKVKPMSEFVEANAFLLRQQHCEGRASDRLLASRKSES